MVVDVVVCLEVVMVLVVELVKHGFLISKEDVSQHHGV